MRNKYPASTSDFICGHCHNFVSAAISLAGVLNRNHCPYCLWSRHLDLYTGGDRLCACKGAMRPIALTLKRTNNKYAPRQGELMLVHHCQECGALSINRIAADDDNERLWELYRRSLHSLPPALRGAADVQGIHLLEEDMQSLVRARLFGQNQAEAGPLPAECLECA